mmetsp:Transcript_25214/g.47647  ORF Transcript_25214/g.47647 Transcript_25214/m.47647 type:complete len:201 (-) Transcript_25214:550-1152(-)
MGHVHSRLCDFATGQPFEHLAEHLRGRPLVGRLQLARKLVVDDILLEIQRNLNLFVCWELQEHVGVERLSLSNGRVQGEHHHSMGHVGFGEHEDAHKGGVLDSEVLCGALQMHHAEGQVDVHLEARHQARDVAERRHRVPARVVVNVRVLHQLLPQNLRRGLLLRLWGMHCGGGRDVERDVCKSVRLRRAARVVQVEFHH